MSNELELRREAALQAMMDVECMPAVPKLDLTMQRAERIPYEKLTALGIAFQPLTTAIQTVVNGAGGSGLYYVNTSDSSIRHKRGIKSNGASNAYWYPFGAKRLLRQPAPSPVRT